MVVGKSRRAWWRRHGGKRKCVIESVKIEE